MNYTGFGNGAPPGSPVFKDGDGPDWALFVIFLVVMAGYVVVMLR